MTRKPRSDRQGQSPKSKSRSSQTASPAEGAPPPKSTNEIASPPKVGRKPEAPYPVGYGRPPKHSQYKPGQSGNPKGRKTQSRNLRTILKQVLEADMAIKMGNRERRMPASEVLVRTVLSQAIKCEPKAVVSLLALIRQSGYGAESDEGGTDVLETPEIDAIVENFLARNGTKETGTPDIDTTETPPAANATPKKPEGKKS